MLELVEDEEQLISRKRIKETPGKNKANEEKVRTITFRISNEFRRQQMVSGIELPQTHSYPYKLEDLNNEHRERLLKIYFEGLKRIPDNAQLDLPVYMPGPKRINYQGKNWGAEINPLTSNVNEILDQWVVDFDQCLKEAELELAQNV